MYSLGISCTPAIRITSTIAVARQISATMTQAKSAIGVWIDSQAVGPSRAPRACSTELR